MAYKTTVTCLKVSLLLFFLLIFQQGFCQFNFYTTDEILIKNQQQLGTNAVALVYKDGKLIYKKALGSFDEKTPAPVASCSKWLTAALVMLYVDEGKLSLDDKVSKYLPVFATYGKGYITIRHCLSHFTGIKSEPGLLNLLKLSKYSSLEEEVNDFASKKDIQDNPGTAFRYSNIGLNIAGRVLEVITHKSFDRLMLERLFRPLGMKNSSFASEKAVNPSGGCISTASDYLNFLIMVLNKGMFNGKRLLSEASVAAMQQPQTTLAQIKYAPKPAEGFNYGLGEWIAETDSKGNTTCVASPGLFGTWPLVDLGRNYASIVFMKSLLNDQKRDAILAFKQSVDETLDAANK